MDLPNVVMMGEQEPFVRASVLPVPHAYVRTPRATVGGTYPEWTNDLLVLDVR